jgi:hypothetical protein
MRTSTLLLSAAALAGATASALLWSELRSERDLNAELTARLEQVSRIPAAEATASAATPSPAVTTRVEPANAPPAAAISVSTESAATPNRATPGTPEDWMARQRRLLNDPRYRDAWREQQRIQSESRREKMIELLGLSGEQADAIIDLGIDRQMSWQLQARPQSMTEETARQQKEKAEADERAFQAKLLEILGPEKRQRYQDYIASSGTRQQVERLRSQLSGADLLRDDQVEPLIAAIHTEQSQMSNELQAYRETLSWDGDTSASIQKFAEHQTAAMKATQARIRTSAGAILSSGQLKQLDEMLKRDLARHEAMLRMQRIQSKLEPPDEVTASQR